MIEKNKPGDEGQKDIALPAAIPANSVRRPLLASRDKAFL
jgi:hypothetical protein